MIRFLPSLVSGALIVLGLSATAQQPAQPASPSAPPKSAQVPAAKASEQPPAASKSDQPSAGSTSAAKKPPAAKPVKKVDINNATLEELRTLPLGEAEAKKVIANRPYKARGELMTKAGLPEGVYLVIKDKVELQQPRTAAKK